MEKRSALSVADEMISRRSSLWCVEGVLGIMAFGDWYWCVIAAGRHGRTHAPEAGDVLAEAEEDVRVERALVRLVDDDAGVGGHVRLRQELAEEHAVCGVVVGMEG